MERLGHAGCFARLIDMVDFAGGGDPPPAFREDFGTDLVCRDSEQSQAWPCLLAQRRCLGLRHCQAGCDGLLEDFLGERYGALPVGPKPAAPHRGPLGISGDASSRCLDDIRGCSRSSHTGAAAGVVVGSRGQLRAAATLLKCLEAAASTERQWDVESDDSEFSAEEGAIRRAGMQTQEEQEEEDVHEGWVLL